MTLRTATAMQIGLITSLGSVLVILVSDLTEDTRAANRLQAQRAQLMDLVETELPAAGTLDVNRLDELEALCDNEGHLQTALVRGAGAGYAGQIAFVAAIDHEGELKGVRITAHSETPGIGDVIEPAKSPWIHGLRGRDALATHWAIAKDGGDIDGVTGATITLRGLVRGVGEAVSEPLPECAQ